MLASRLLVAIVLLPLGAWVIALGGFPFTAVVAAMSALAAWEVARMLRKAGFRVSELGMPLGAALVVIAFYLQRHEGAAFALTFILLGSMTLHLFDFEQRGRQQAATDYAASVMGMVYCGWLASYMVALRNLPEGKWWFLIALPSVWLADSGAYLIGRRWGKHLFAPRLSPHKTWEGYIGGLMSGALSGWVLAALWGFGAGPESVIVPWKGAILGLLLAALTPLGDLGESMIKRQVGVKDSGYILPGHGGIFDRIDSWLWGGVLGYYLVLWWLGR
ncbi:MAG: phosphatidate cytidylyltransferase [Anaerolineales bacterium]|nr:phosphatidate cytidylyltransferase [Anaerolineales bacterium]MCS7247590.1 phosphatidate cytidylyltransferase [Anaerolineales bacterium]MDW8161401.1 phosphatidate cytidylyltransferase [Anaerolineales bacterium]MDW8446438.1 phosphatidate cytidylyltransferase [Anaerolineales bacterium]